MIDFDRFWIEGNNPYESQDEDEDDTADVVPPGVTAEAIREWEKEHGVTLPEPIRTALGRRNGGYVRNAPIQVLPLEQIVPVDDDFWEWTHIEENEAPDHGLLFVFGNETEIGGTFFMNFNARGPGGQPSVYIDHHGESTYLVNDTLAGLFEAELASSAVPDVDWSEAQEDLPVVARETIDLSALYSGKLASKDQILARQGETLILFTRERSPEGETLTRTTLPMPLDASWAEVGPYRPAPIATLKLHLQPTESDGIVQVRSETNADGRWKNLTSRGVPIYVTFESTDRDRLQSLRTQLFGAQGAARAQARQDRQTELQGMLDTLSPEQRTAAMLQATLTLKDEIQSQFAARFGDIGPVPPELAEAAAAMRRKLEEMTRRVHEKTAANPPDPETLQRIKDLLRDPEAG